MYADIGPSSAKQQLVSSTSQDNHQVEYSELTHAPLQPSHISKADSHPAGK